MRRARQQTVMAWKTPATPRSTAGKATRPVTAIQAPIGARPSESPSTRWEREVNRFVYEYPQTIRMASGARARHTGFSR